ncbi:MAG: hypothetical protein EBS05_22385 [Proteobacteria bacterium]|nr:hypothetical protein [Pseudomonadota bacterium]
MTTTQNKWEPQVDRSPVHQKHLADLDEIRRQADAATDAAKAKLREFSARQSAWEVVLADGAAKAERCRYAREQLDILNQRRSQEVAALDALTGKFEFTAEYYREIAHVSPHTNSQWHMAWKGMNPFVHYGALIAGCDAAIARVKELLAGFEAEEATALAIAKKYAKDNGFADHDFGDAPKKK